MKAAEGVELTGCEFDFFFLKEGCSETGTLNVPHLTPDGDRERETRERERERERERDTTFL